MAKSSAMDPHWGNCGSGFGFSNLGHCESGSGSKDLMTENSWILFVRKISYFSNKKLHIISSLASMADLSQEKPLALKTKHPSLQNNTFFAAHFAYMHPDPDLADHSQYGSMRIRIHSTDTSILFFSNNVEVLRITFLRFRVFCGFPIWFSICT